MLKRSLLRALEWVLGRFFDLAGFLSAARPPVPRRIAIFEVNGLGDLVLAEPAVRRLRQYFPQAEIALVATPEFIGVLSGHPDIQHFIPLSVPWRPHRGKYNPFRYPAFLRELAPLRAYAFDAGIDTRGDLRKQAMMAYLGIPIRVGYDRGIGGKDPGYRGRLLTDVVPHSRQIRNRAVENIDLIDGWALRLGISKCPPPAEQPVRRLSRPDRSRIAINVEANMDNKLWPIECWAELLSKIGQMFSCEIYLLSHCLGNVGPFLNAFERRGVHVIPRQVKASELPSALREMDLFIGLDSGPMHVADMVGCAVIALFGPFDGRIWHPYRNGIAAVIHNQPACELAPCEKHFCQVKDCRCIRTVTPDQVLQRAVVLLDDSSDRELRR